MCISVQLVYIPPPPRSRRAPMVTPSSSVTSASPPLAYAQPHSPSLSTDTDPLEREERERAIRKFLASAELSVVSPVSSGTAGRVGAPTGRACSGISIP